MSDIVSYLSGRFDERTEEGVEYWSNEGYWRGWLDFKIGVDCRDAKPYDCPKMYYNDWLDGYTQGWGGDSKDDEEMGF
jgi:hypothetical protein